MKKQDEYLEFIASLAQIIKDNKLSEIEFKENGLEIKLNQNLSTNNIVSSVINNPTNLPTNNIIPTNEAVDSNLNSENTIENYENHPGAIKSPMVGLVYTSPAPDQENFISEGDTVNEGDTLLLIESMKVYNPIKAPKSGTVKKILVSNKQAVEYNEVLLIIE